MNTSYERPSEKRETDCGGSCACCAASRRAPVPGAPEGRRLVGMVLMVFVLPLASAIAAGALVPEGGLRTAVVFGWLFCVLAALPSVFRWLFKRKVKEHNECNA